MAGISCRPPGAEQKGGGAQQAQVGKLTQIPGYLNLTKMVGNLNYTKWRLFADTLLGPGQNRREEALSRLRWANNKYTQMAGNLK